MCSSDLPLLDGRERIGTVLRTRDGVSPLFISTGHRVGLSTAVKFVLACGDGYRLPKPQREADRWSLFLRGGAALIHAKASFVVDEQAQAPGLAAGARVAANGSRSKVDLGYFLGARLRRSFNPQWALVGGADFLGGYKLKVADGDRYALLDLSRVWFLSIGLEYAWDRRDLP